MGRISGSPIHRPVKREITTLLEEGSSEIKNTEITDEGPVTMETKPNRLDRSLALWHDVAIVVASPSSSRRHCGGSARHIIGIR